MSDDVGDFLAHHGIKGMHWGRHKAGDSGGSSSSGGGTKTVSKGDVARVVDSAHEKTAKDPKKKFTSQEIKDARIRQEARIDRVNQHANDLNLQISDKGRKLAAKQYQKSFEDYVNSPDAAAAEKMTKGEKITAAFGVGVIALSVASLAVRH